MKRFSLKYSLIAYRLDQLWFPIAFLILFILLTLILGEPSKNIRIATTYLGIIVPLIGGVMSASAVLSDSALELRFSTPTRPLHLLLERAILTLLIQAICAVTYTFFAKIFGIDFSSIGNWVSLQLAWLIPTLTLMAIGTVGTLLGAQVMTGVFLVSLIWLVELFSYGWMAQNNGKYILIFTGALLPEHPDLVANQMTLAILSVGLLLASWFLLHKQERYL